MTPAPGSTAGMRPPLRDAMLFPLLALVLGIILAGSGAFVARERTQILAQSRLKSQIQAQLLAEHASAVFRQAELGLRSVLPLLEAGIEVPPPRATQALRRQVLFLPAVRDAFVFGPDGVIRLAARGSASPSLDIGTLVSAHREGLVDTRISSLPRDETGRGWLTLSMRIDSADGGLAGILLAVLDPAYFAARYSDYRTIDVDLVALYDAGGLVLASWTQPPTAATRLSELPLVHDMPTDELLKGGLRTVESPTAVATGFSLPEFPLRIVLAYGKAALLDRWRRQALVIGLVAFLLAASLSASTLVIRHVVSRRLTAEIDLAASRGREELTQVFRRVAMIGAEADELRHFLQASLRVVRGFLGWPAALVHLRPPGVGLGEAPVNVWDGENETILRAAALEMERSEILASGEAPPAGSTALADSADGVLHSHGAVLVRLHEAGSPACLFAYLAGGAPTAPMRELIEQVSALIYRTAVHRLEALARQRLEEQLHHARRVESLGMMAGGMAHDLNNLMTVVLGSTELVAARMDPADRSQKPLDDIRVSARKATELSDRLLAAAGKSWIVARPMDLCAFLRELEPELRKMLPAGARLELGPCADPLPVRADAGLLHRALLSLVENSIEALPPGGGAINLSSGSRPYDRAGLGSFLFADGMKPGLYAWIEIRDNGVGMSSEAVTNLFDPFFSTKFLGRGLGLPAVMGIVRQHGGTMRVVSQERTGTSMTILLPCGEARS